MTVTPLRRDQDCSLKNRESWMCRLSWFLDPGGCWSKTTVVGLYFIFPGICTLSLPCGYDTTCEASVSFLGDAISKQILWFFDSSSLPAPSFMMFPESLVQGCDVAVSVRNRGLIVTAVMALVLEFQCLLHPAVAIHSVIKSDGIKHNKKDDLMDSNVDCY
ncbi:hypothetical protein STEG23_011285 [Scotinomys teguina]